MQVFQDVPDWRQTRTTFSPEKTVGFVPTMGNCHQGHASLMAKSIAENDVTVASIFVNPTQFNQQDDFIHYPRTLDNDLALLEKQGVDYCLLPNESDIYACNRYYQVQENHHSTTLEGAYRSGHFTGVLTVVMKLFQLVKPHRAYFGEKDYQQLQLIQGMVKAFFMDIEVIACPTIREPSNLACSSRNNRLTKQEREKADQFARIFHQTTCDIEEIRSTLEAHQIDIIYLEEQQQRRYVAVQLGTVRLIDNYKK